MTPPVMTQRDIDVLYFVFVVGLLMLPALIWILSNSFDNQGPEP